MWLWEREAECTLPRGKPSLVLSLPSTPPWAWSLHVGSYSCLLGQCNSLLVQSICQFKCSGTYQGSVMLASVFSLFKPLGNFGRCMDNTRMRYSSPCPRGPTSFNHLATDLQKCNPQYPWGPWKHEVSWQQQQGMY